MCQGAWPMPEPSPSRARGRLGQTHCTLELDAPPQFSQFGQSHQLVTPSQGAWGPQNAPPMRKALDKYFTFQRESNRECGMLLPSPQRTALPLSRLEVLFFFYQKGVISVA